MITCFILTRKPRLTPAHGEWWSLTGVQAGHQTRIMANLRTARKSAYTTGKCVINSYLRTIRRKAWFTQISARQSTCELLSRRSQIMRLCYLTPSLFKYLHKTPYYREMLDRNIESEMYFYCWWVSPVSDCAIRETSDQRGKWWLKTFFTFDFHILLLQRHTDARIIPCHCISIKKGFKWGPCWEPTLPATETVSANWIVVDRFKMSQITFTSIHILANQNSYHDDKST